MEVIRRVSLFRIKTQMLMIRILSHATYVSNLLSFHSESAVDIVQLLYFKSLIVNSTRSYKASERIYQGG